jgi:hypothetical protein
MRVVKSASTLFLVPALAIAAVAGAQQTASAESAAKSPNTYLGFDANEYPGDALLPALRKQFAFAGYWITNPPLVDHNSWAGKRATLLQNGFGFLVVANGRIDNEILAARKAGKSPAAFGRHDAAAAVAAAHREGFPPQTILFLDQEEGGRMLPEQAGYLLAWTEEVAGSGYRPGVYASNHPVPDGKGPDGKPATITTIQDLQARVAAAHLHEISFWVIQDACPPSPGCVVRPSAPPAINLSGSMDAAAWQFAQSPRTSFARSCGATYNADGQCYAPGVAGYRVDLNVATSPDPSHGR